MKQGRVPIGEEIVEEPHTSIGEMVKVRFQMPPPIASLNGLPVQRRFRGREV